MTGTPPRAAGYCRVSTDEQAREGISLAHQERRIRDYAAERGWELVAIYTEPRGISGSVPFAERPAGSQAFDADVDVLIVFDWDRLSRDAADFLTVVRDREVVSVTQDGEPPLLRDLRAVLGQEEKRKIRQRAKDAAEALAREGRYNGARSIGYRSEGETIVPVPHEVPTVHRIDDEFLAGRKFKHIAVDLNDDGLRTARGGLWSGSAVRDVLDNPVYVGRIRHKGREYPGRHEAIRDAETWEKVQTLLTARTNSRGKGRGRPTEGQHLFVGGLLKCGECGGSMVPRKSRDAYFCNGRVKHGLCSVKSVPRESIDNAAYSYFETVGLDREATRAQFAEAQGRRLAQIRTAYQEAEREALRAAEAFNRVRGHYQEGRIEAEDWREQREELTQRREAARAAVEQLRGQVDEVEQEGAEIDGESEFLHLLADVRKAITGQVRDAQGVEAVRATLMRLFDRFILHPPYATSDLATPGRIAVDCFPTPDPGGHPARAVMEHWDEGWPARGVMGHGLEEMEWPSSVIEVWVRPQVLEGWHGGDDDRALLPVLRREPLHLPDRKAAGPHPRR